MKRLDATAEGEEGHQEGIEKTTGGGGASEVDLPSEGREAACRWRDGLLGQEQCSVFTVVLTGGGFLLHDVVPV